MPARPDAARNGQPLYGPRPHARYAQRLAQRPLYRGKARGAAGPRHRRADPPDRRERQAAVRDRITERKTPSGGRSLSFMLFS